MKGAVVSHVKHESQEPSEKMELWEPIIPEGGRRTSCSPAIKGELSRAELLELEEFGLNQGAESNPGLRSTSSTAEGNTGEGEFSFFNSFSSQRSGAPH